MMADWLFDGIDRGLGLKRQGRDLRDLWIDTFISYARACYDACDQIITLYGGNQVLQRRLGSPAERMRSFQTASTMTASRRCPYHPGTPADGRPDRPGRAHQGRQDLYPGLRAAVPRQSGSRGPDHGAGG